LDFTFGEDPLLFQATLRDFLAKECTPEVVRALWASESGHSPELWARLTALGIPGAQVPEAHGGMGLDACSAVLLFEETGRAALPGPLLATAAVAAPLLAGLAPERGAAWLARIASGEAVVAVSDPSRPLVADAHLAALLLLVHDDEVHAVEPDRVGLTRQPANDPGRRLFSVTWSPSAATRLACGAAGRALAEAALQRGALAAAAELCGVGERLVELAAGYAGQRRQFGQPIGAFQAVKHMLASVKVKLEYARPALYRAAWSVAHAAPGRGCHVSMAKRLAGEAALQAARTALQVHGAIGYTWEQDLHIWMRRAWSLETAWGDGDFHRRRVARTILAPEARLGPGETFAAAEGEG
jgi:alkylation response protein AidB-like acyl-CoA dehydrogenase